MQDGASQGVNRQATAPTIDTNLTKPVRDAFYRAVWPGALAILLAASPAEAASEEYCRAWARGAATLWVGQLKPDERRQLTYPRLHDVIFRFATFCGLAEEDFAEPDYVWTGDLVTEARKDAGEVPKDPKTPVVRRDGEAAPSANVAPRKVAPPQQPAIKASGGKPTPDQVCRTAGMTVIWRDKYRWRCRRP